MSNELTLSSSLPPFASHVPTPSFLPHPRLPLSMHPSQVCRYICDPLEKDEYYIWHTYAIKENRYIIIYYNCMCMYIVI